MDFVLGFLGALLVLVLALAGFALGWWVRGVFEKNRRAVPVQQAAEDERRRLTEQQNAFRRIQNYTVEDAYGMNRSELKAEEK